MKGLFDFDGDGHTDPLELLLGMGLLDPSSPFNKVDNGDNDSDFDDDFDFDDEEDDDYE